MEPVARFALETHAGPYSGWPDTSQLIVDGARVGARVPGHAIEAQYCTPFGNLLITSFDCPFEESNRFLLLDEAHRIVADAALSTPYGSWLLHAHWPTGADTLALHHSADHFHVLRIVPPGGWRRRAPRLVLQRVDGWRDDARMATSHARLAAMLDAIDTSR